MPKTNRRDILRLASASLTFPLLTLLTTGCTPNKDEDESTSNTPPVTDSERTENTDEPQSKKETQSEADMKIHYLEIVTTDTDALCNQYAAAHGITFNEPDASLGGARTAQLTDGGTIGIRGPLRETETPVIRPYVLVDDLKASVDAAAEAGAEVAIAAMEIPGHGTIAVVIQGGIECGLWQLESKE